MTDRQPLEETPEAAAAVADDTTVPQLSEAGGPDADTPEFREPTAAGTAPGGGSAGAAAPATGRTGADQPWEPEDLAAADGRDPTPENVERARRDLAENGPAAIERTVP